MKIGSNINSLKAQGALTRSSVALSKVNERLASGMRINHASDDAAGLSIADGLRSNGRLYAQSIRNTNDAVSLLNVRESGLQSMNSILTRIAELAEQAANGVYSTAQRASLDKEAQALKAEFNRTIETVQFNGIKLLDGSAGAISVQVGIDGSSNSRITLAGLSASSTTTTTVSGEFSEPSTYGVTGRSEVVQSGDINGDGFDDIIEAGNSGGGLTALLSNGDGTFSVNLLSVQGHEGLTRLVDLNNDGRLDFVAANFAGQYAYFGNGDGTFSATLIGPFGSSTDASLADLNNDGVEDLVTAYEGLNKFTVRMGAGGGTFGAAVTYATPANFGFAGVVPGMDFNNDGFNDLLTIHGNITHIRLNVGNGTFAPIVTVTSGNYLHEVGDINNDGNDDLLVQVGADLQLRLGNGNGTFKALSMLIPNTKGSTNPIDLNGDGVTDLINFDSTGVDIYLGNGDGTFRFTDSIGDAGSDFGTPAFGDFNNDGALDFALTGYNNNSVSVYMADADVQTTQGSIALGTVDLTTASGARETLSSVRSLMEGISLNLATVGAEQSRLNSVLSYSRSARESILAAEGRIRDADTAQDAAEFVRLQILQKMSASILTQANQQPQLVLALLNST